MNPRRLQTGYMMEIPLILLAVAIVLAIAIPKLPVALGKAAVIVGALIWVGGLYYMIVIPGWRPNPSRLPRWARLAVFAGIAGLLLFVAGAYVVGR